MLQKYYHSNITYIESTKYDDFFLIPTAVYDGKVFTSMEKAVNYIREKVSELEKDSNVSSITFRLQKLDDGDFVTCFYGRSK